MALDPTDLANVVSLGAPVLMLDTCVLLDVVRDITRKDVQLHNVQAAMSMLRAAETNSDLVVLMAEQVSIELRENLSEVETGAVTSLEKFLAQALRVDQVAAVFGAVGNMATSHLSDHVARAMLAMERWKTAALPVTPSGSVPARAIYRVVSAIAPSRKGKDSTKDCLIVETYLEAAAQLRSAGFTGKIVFGSSNTDDYMDKVTRQLHSVLENEFASYDMHYGMNFGSMKHLLGI